MTNTYETNTAFKPRCRVLFFVINIIYHICHPVAYQAVLPIYGNVEHLLQGNLSMCDLMYIQLYGRPYRAAKRHMRL